MYTPNTKSYDLTWVYICAFRLNISGASFSGRLLRHLLVFEAAPPKASEIVPEAQKSSSVNNGTFEGFDGRSNRLD